MIRSAHNDRYIMAHYYAYGRVDATDGLAELDPIQFAEHYSQCWNDLERGTASYCPSVQDAWNQYRAMKAST